MATPALNSRAGCPPRRLDKLFAVYESLANLFQEAGRSIQQRETIDRMLRLAPLLQPLRQAQALKNQARFLDGTGSMTESAEALERALTILRTLSSSPSKPPETDAQLISTLVGVGRAQALAGNFSGAVVHLKEAIRRSETSIASEPHIAKSARQLYWSHIALGDVFGSPQRFSLDRPGQAAEQYQKARLIAERLVSADPGNEMAKLDLARAFTREAVAVAATQPARAVTLLEESHSVILQIKSENSSALDSRLTYLTSLVGPLVQLGQFERARLHMSEARRLFSQMRQAGVKVDERVLLRAEAIRLYAMGHAREALAEAQKHFALLPKKINKVLSANFESVELLERMRAYAAGADDAACASATERLTQIWNNMRSTYSQSRFVLTQAERIHALSQKGCAPESTPVSVASTSALRFDSLSAVRVQLERRP